MKQSAVDPPHCAFVVESPFSVGEQTVEFPDTVPFLAAQHTARHSEASAIAV